MTKPEISDAMVEAGARAYAAVAYLHGGCVPEGVPVCIADGDCMCAKSARAVLEAAMPMALAAEQERCAKIADMFAEVNIEAAGDTILLDPVLSGRDRSDAACAVSEELRIDGCVHSAMFHAAQNIATAIRSSQEGERE